MPQPTFVLGLDLAGPGNREATVAAGFTARGGGLALLFLEQGLDDGGLLDLVRARVPAGAPLVAGLDAPLSYNPGGGDRPGDRALRRVLAAAGLAPGTVMPPTLTRMVYLTLRGLAVARLLQAVHPDPRIVEVHPGGVLALRGAPAAAVRALKNDAGSRAALVARLGDLGLADLPAGGLSDHAVAACAAALGAWDWSRGAARWSHPADPPLHPFPYAC